MIVAGCDIGALTTKAVVMKDGVILGSEIMRSHSIAAKSAAEVMDGLLGRLALSYSDIAFCVGTGYGRSIVPFASENISEISCHARGAHWCVPAVRTIIDGGGQDCKAIRIDERGHPVDFRMNTRCAAGTGRALEIMASSLGVDISEVGPLSLQAKNPVHLQQFCCIITEIEIRHLILEGRDSADIAAGISDVTARSILDLVYDLGVKEKVGFTGGIAKNIGVVRCIERRLKTKLVNFSVDTQFIGAIGAAVIAADRVKERA